MTSSRGGVAYAIDSHCHLGRFFEDPARGVARIEEMRQGGMTACVAAVIGLDYHGNLASYPWRNTPKVPDTEHPIIYSAHGSHASYLWWGSHDYKKVKISDWEAIGELRKALPPATIKTLTDYTDTGAAWDTWENVESFDYGEQRGLGPTWRGTWPNWLKKDSGDKTLGNEDPASGPVWRWGNYRWDKVPVVNQYRLDHGPKGPVDTGYFETLELD